MSLIRGKEMTVADAARALGINDSTLRQRIHDQKYPSRKVGARVMVEIPLEELRLAEDRRKRTQAGTTMALATLPEDEATRYTQAAERLIRPYVTKIARLEEQVRTYKRKYELAQEMVEEYKQQRDEARKQAGETGQ